MNYLILDQVFPYKSLPARIGESRSAGHATHDPSVSIFAWPPGSSQIPKGMPWKVNTNV